MNDKHCMSFSIFCVPFSISFYLFVSLSLRYIRLPTLTMLDGIPISEAEKIPALNLHGDDLPMRRAIYDRYLPQAEKTTPQSYARVRIPFF
jgi:hypothetical protein